MDIKELIEKIKPTQDDIIKWRMRYVPFCLHLIFIASELENKGMVMRDDLVKEFNISSARATQILSDFVSLGFLVPSEKSWYSYYKGVKNNDEFVIKKYVPIAIQMLKTKGVIE